jgi:ligand-binding SRPBCC domain-containing protein
VTPSYRHSSGAYRIELRTEIHAPIERCFDLSRSIDLHTASTAATRERAIAGVTSGLIGKGETVTFRARQFGVWLTHTTLITAFEPPYYFRDEMTRGFFAYFAHDHRFERTDDATVMQDRIAVRSRFGFLSRMIDRVIIVPRLRSLLATRNLFIKQVAESDDWKLYLR